MPRRKIPLANGEYYHIFNRGVNKIPIFNNASDYKRVILATRYYSSAHTPMRLSRFLKLSNEKRANYWLEIKNLPKLISIISYCFMPNHFHFLLKQKLDRGISKFIKYLQASYALYFNTKYERIGPLLQGQFKAVRIEDDEQLLHVSRYIHLNPYTSYILTDIKELEAYPWSSFPDYLGKSETKICSTDEVLSFFRDKEKYKEFVFNQADYQRKLEDIKHLVLE